MATMRIRGLDDQVLAQLKDQAVKEGNSLNSVVLRLLQGGKGLPQAGATPVCDDLGALVGTWTSEEDADFARQTAAFAALDAYGSV